MNKILCSTGTFIGRKNDFNYELIPEFVEKLDCDGFEFMIEPQWSNLELMLIADYLSKFNLNFVSSHFDKDIGVYISQAAGMRENGEILKSDELLKGALLRFDLNCMVAEKIGAKVAVLHLWGGIESDKDIKFNLNAYNDLLEIAQRYAIILTVENIVCGVADNAIGYLKNLYEMYRDNIKFTFDVRQAAFHKSVKATCEAEFLWQNNLIAHSHIADYKGEAKDWTKLRPVLTPEEGDVDFNYFFNFMKSKNYAGAYTLESGGELEKINKSLDFIRKNIGE